MRASMAGMMAALVALFAGSCGGSERSTSPLPTYTPTAGDLYKAYSTALDELYTAQDDLQDARARILSHLQVVPEIALDAVQEARGYDVPIDDLSTAIEQYARALELARAPYAER